jgi:hypothetical protein
LAVNQLILCVPLPLKGVYSKFPFALKKATEQLLHNVIITYNYYIYLCRL